MASEPTEEPSQFTLQILSLSDNVPQPLVFENLPVTTTVQELKERIRDCVSTNPPNDAQRLIHRGRLLVREAETMLELFGQDPLRSTDRQTLHLVLRDLSEGPTPTAPAQLAQQPGSGTHNPGYQHRHHGNIHPHVRIGIGGPPRPNVSYGFPQVAAINVPGNGTQRPPGWTSQHAFQNHYHVLARLGMANQAQPPGHDSTGSHATHTPGDPGSTTPAGASPPSQPEATRRVIREAVGPDGQVWRFTVNEAVTNSTQDPTQRPVRTPTPFYTSSEDGIPTMSQPPVLGYDTQTAHVVDASSARRVIADAMRRNARGSSPNPAPHQGQQPIWPGVTTPRIPSRFGSSTGITPDPFRARPANIYLGRNVVNRTSATEIPEVYILSSPNGPRAILLNGTSGTYYSPQLRSFPATGFPLPSMASTASGSAPYAQNGVLPRIVRRTPVASVNAPSPPVNNLPPEPHQLQPQQRMQMQAQLGHGIDNPQLDAIRLAQIWPHVWMILRLAGFIWWFTTPTSSWLRWITVVSIAITLFIVNTGVMHPLAEQIAGPLRRHLENLIPPVADADARQQQGAAADNARDGDANMADPARPDGPNPADTAARLIQQRHQNNANWLLDQVRRLERAGILFIASLAPGLAERHIAQAEADALARQRQQEAVVAARTAAAAAAASAAAQAGSEDTNETHNRASSETRESSPDGEPPAYETQPASNGAAA
ncbi:hypothetical protein GGR50DRAFT_640468 [Xylaria sp. CBS 124048]|nr:hypothetical protein GGR50DRAFT_640468 [Xylaria sp. CBS 124048]